MPRTLIGSGSPFEAEIARSRAVVHGDWIFVSGTTGFDYSTMKISEHVDSKSRRCAPTGEALATCRPAALPNRRTPQVAPVFESEPP